MEDYESAADSLHTEPIMIYRFLKFGSIPAISRMMMEINAEFSFAPLKLSDDQWAVMNRISDSQEADQNGRYVW